MGNVIAYNNISDADLDVIVSNFVLSFPTAGQKTLQGRLMSRGYHIQWWRIQESLLHVDPWAGPLRKEIGTRDSMLQNGDSVKRDWLVWSEEKQALFCFPCRIFIADQNLGHLSSVSG